MTCYETLRASAPAADAPMAHHFVKWWRNKFRNGYKKFSMGTEGERTDTEELIGRASSQCSAPPDVLPSEARALLQPATPPPIPARKSEAYSKRPPSPQRHADVDEKQPRLRFEELTCDVELQHPESSKQQPLQFSFTLYDLDGHGRMTKDDIAGIVSTIYESIGKSVTVPHYGSKTIQVRLTVVPEDGWSRNHRDRRDGRRRRRRERAANVHVAPPAECADNSDDEPHDRLSHEDDASSKSSYSGDRQPPQRPPPVLRQRSSHHRHTRREPRERKLTKKRSGSLQRRELLEIIQANMEKNRLSFQASRKPCEPVTNEEEILHKYQKLRNRSYTVSDKPHAFQKLKTEANNNGYLDLASGGDSNLCRYDRYLHAVICSSARHANTGYHQKHSQTPRHTRTSHNLNQRSRSHDLPAQNHSTHQPRVLQIIFL
ncbi:protein naked cuticle homolog [Maniola hyperantus]|uniref:protein naked cuticle homolog n=1 Tax=Aphantopus hyperantus TaxID=2795564 RepID=UPI00156969D9|nr:protein naked cuticle homolog 1 [Maniola hyperantus]